MTTEAADFTPLKAALRTCFTAVGLPVPDMTVEDGETLVLKGTGMSVWQEDRKPKVFTLPLWYWVVGATVVTPATRWEPGDADMVEIGAYRTPGDAAMNLVLAMLKNRMENALAAEAEVAEMNALQAAITEARLQAGTADPIGSMIASMTADIANGIPKDIVLAYARRHIVGLRERLETAKEGHQAFHDAIQATVQFIMSNGDGEYMPSAEFAEKAKKVVDSAGVRHRDGLRYKDDQIEILTDYNGLDLQVTWVVNNNPTTMVMKGDVIRHHGEHTFLTKHLNHLVETLL